MKKLKHITIIICFCIISCDLDKFKEKPYINPNDINSPLYYYNYYINNIVNNIKPPTVTGPNKTTNLRPTWSWGSVTNATKYRYGFSTSSWTVVSSSTKNITPTSDLVFGNSYTLYVQAGNDNDYWSNSGSFTVTITNPLSNSNLLVYLKFNSISGGIITDESGNGNNATVSDGTLVSGKYGNSISFDGVNDYLTITTNPTLNGLGDGSYSIFFWVKAVYNNTFNYLMCKHEKEISAAVPFEIWIGSASYIWFLEMQSDPYGSGRSIGGGTVGDGNWHLISLVHSSTNRIYLYVDGVWKSEDNTYHPAVNTANIYIGLVNFSDGSTKYFTGELDELLIWNRELTQDEITMYYNSNGEAF